jgi:transcriptional regulator with XRE-family HTH domain
MCYSGAWLGGNSMTDQKGYCRLVEQSGIRWARLAAMTGMRSARLSEWKHGKAELRPEELQKIMAVIDRRLIELRKRQQSQEETESPKGWQIRQARAEFGITQAELAQKARVSQSEISLFETGHSSLAPEQVTRIGDSCLALAEAQVAALEARVKSLEKQTAALDAEPSRLVRLSAMLSPAMTQTNNPKDKTLREFAREMYRAGEESRRKDRQIETLNMRVANLTNQVLSLQEQNSRLREWLQQEQRAALEHAKAKELEEKILKTEIER